MKTPFATVAVLTITAMAAASCSSGDDPFATGSADSETIVVGSANFPENLILGEVYTQALLDAGYEVEQNLDIGSRDILFGELERCRISVAPEYNGALLSYLDQSAATSETDAVDAALDDKLPDSLETLESSQAQNTNALVMMRGNAEVNGVQSVADLADVADDMTLGAPPEFETRNDGVPGLKRRYGIEFEAFKSLDYSGPITYTALTEQDIEVAMMFTTAPQLSSDDVLTLKDPDGALGVNNVVPLICNEAVDEGARDVLNEVSSSLTTEELIEMNARYSDEKADTEEIAKDWVRENIDD